jgi:hypothetical protein
MSQSRTEYSKPLLPFTNPSSQLQAAIAEDSNRSLDWMWYADQMESVAERRYCLERARYIDPNDRQLLKALAALNRQETRRRVTTSHQPGGWLARFLATINL